jgi:predicted nucleotidyltransferase component of viral defense system
MNRIATTPADVRREGFARAGLQLEIPTVIIEKDFWVCWMLGLLFGREDWREALVFKGGTALSKVFGVLRRFSEDIDLSLSPAALGIAESDVEQADSRKQRDQWMERMESRCWARCANVRSHRTNRLELRHFTSKVQILWMM